MTRLESPTGLQTDLYQLTMAQLYFRHGLHERDARFEHFFRRYPDYGEHEAGYAINADGFRDAKPHPSPKPPGTRRVLLLGDSFTFETVAGDLDCLGTPAGTTGYADLIANASEMLLDDDLRVMVVSIEDLVRMKRAAGRPKDLIAVEILTALREERDRLT